MSNIIERERDIEVFFVLHFVFVCAQVRDFLGFQLGNDDLSVLSFAEEILAKMFSLSQS